MMFKRVFEFPSAKSTAEFICQTKASIYSWYEDKKIVVWAYDENIALKWDEIAQKLDGKAITKSWEKSDN